MTRVPARFYSAFGFAGLFLCILLSSRLPLGAQSTFGSISGSVADSSGAAVTDAQVTLTNLATSEKRTQTTGGDGLYLFPNLLPGRYSIEIEKAGFKKYSRPEVIVQVNQSSHIDAILDVGNLSQVVEVTAETPLLQPETSSLGTVVGTRTANELPLNGRNIFNLTTITPSVVAQGNTLGTVVGKNPFDFAYPQRKRRTTFASARFERNGNHQLSSRAIGKPPAQTAIRRLRARSGPGIALEGRRRVEASAKIF
jgi:hypothetical protein